MYTLGLVFVTEITMKIGWLLLLQLLMVASQSTTDDDDMCDGGLLRREMQTLSSRQQHLFEHLQSLLLQQQFIIKRLGKLSETVIVNMHVDFEFKLQRRVQT